MLSIYNLCQRKYRIVVHPNFTIWKIAKEGALLSKAVESIIYCTVRDF